MLNYAPVEKRFEHIASAWRRMPALFEQAKANLVDAPEVWNRVAQEENDGNIELIDKTLRAAAPDAQKAAYDRPPATAIAALRDFNAFLKDTLPKKPATGAWARKNTRKKFAYVLAIGKIAGAACWPKPRRELKATRAEMAKLAAPKTVEAGAG